MDRLQLLRALKALIAMSKTPYDTPASTFALQNKTRKVLEGGCLRAQNLPIRHLTLEADYTGYMDYTDYTGYTDAPSNTGGV